MRDEAWDRMVGRPDEAELGAALERVRGRAAGRRSRAARLWRVGGLAAAFIVTFGAGLVVGRATTARHELSRMWSVGAQSLEASRATFVAVPVGANP